jgi:uncharacterized membrane protein
MLRYLVAYVATAVVFLASDAVWLTRAIGFYRSELGDMLADKPNLGAAAVFYPLYVLGIVVLAVMPATRSGGWQSALFLGGTFGLVAYATYDLTNLATLSRWSIRVTVADMAWGTFVTAIASLGGFFAVRMIAADS